jgi:hypothetical protein
MTQQSDTSKKLSSISLQELKKVPYLDPSKIGGRMVLLQPFFDGQAWHLWTPMSDGKLHELAVVDFQVGQYFAKEPASPERDVQFHFFELITKRALFPEVQRFANGIENDLYNLGASLWKLDTFFGFEGPAREGSDRLALTELEYILVVCRSLLDLLQAVIAKLWQRITLPDSKIKKKNLPESFSDVVVRDKKPQLPEAITAKYGLPLPLAHFYSKHATFFQRLCDLRDDIVHRGTKSFPIFRAENGFAVVANQAPFSTCVPWDETAFAPNQLGSLRYFVAYLIRETLRVCEEFALVMMQASHLPSDIAPNYELFLRSYHTEQLRRLELVCADPWEKFVLLPS